MGNLLYIVAAIFVALWAICYIGFDAGSNIHILLIIGMFSVLVRLIQVGKPVR